MDRGKRNLTDILAYIEFLGKHNQLIRVKSEVDPSFELADFR
jgi:3-polyprenyl-4-hydroxybenzoate decarboxylase